MNNEIENTYIEFGGVQIAVRTNISDVTQFVRESHSAMLTQNATNCVEVIDVIRRGQTYTVGAVTYEFDPSVPSSALFDDIQQKILQGFVSARNDLLWIHAGVVRKRDRALVIAGASANGKSTLVRQLCTLGWKFLSDEAAPIDGQTLCATPYPRSLIWRKYPGQPLERGNMGTLQRETWSVPAELTVREPARVADIVFTTYKPETQTKIESLSPAQASLRLLAHAKNLKAQPTHFVEVAAKLVRESCNRTITFAHGEDAALKLNGLAGG